MLKPISEVIEALDTRISDDKMKKVTKGGGNFSYVPWEVTARELDRIFGKLNWSTTQPQLSAGGAPGMYLATLVLKVRALDEDGTVVEKEVAGFGRGAAIGRGGEVSDNLQVHDTAASAAGSDAFSKATKMLGDAFGLFLYEKGDPAYAATSNSAPRQSAPSTSDDGSVKKNPWGGYGKLSVKQTDILLKNGYTPAQLDAMPKEEASSLIDGIIKGGKKSEPKAQPEGAPAPF